MQGDFQLEVLRFLLQSVDGKKFLPLIDNKVFDLPNHKLIVDLAISYLAKYNDLPSKAGLLEHFEKTISASVGGLDSLNKMKVEKEIARTYEPFNTSTSHLREEIIRYAQYKKVQTMFVEYSEKIQDPAYLVPLRSEMDSIIRMEEKLTGLEEDVEDGFLLRGFVKGRASTYMVGMPTYIKALNEMTAIGGFSHPQLVVFMAAPKSFKTGVLLNIALPYVSRGKKVLWIDLENGADDIKSRANQCMMQATYTEIRDGELDDELEKMTRIYKGMGGDFYVKSLQAHISTMADVEAIIDELIEKFGWKPDIIALDYADLLAPVDRKIIEKRLKIQSIYFDIKNTNQKYQTLTFTLSQVNKAAVNKATIDMTAFAEDFGKAANCDAAFAICQTKEERAMNFARIIPVVQRKGAGFTGKEMAYLNIDYKTQYVKELTYNEACEILSTNPVTASNSDLFTDD